MQAELSQIFCFLCACLLVEAAPEVPQDYTAAVPESKDPEGQAFIEGGAQVESWLKELRELKKERARLEADLLQVEEMETVLVQRLARFLDSNIEKGQELLKHRLSKQSKRSYAKRRSAWNFMDSAKRTATKQLILDSIPRYGRK